MIRRLSPALLCLAMVASAAEPVTYPWQGTYAAIDATGGLTLQQTPFVLVKGASVRYIDFVGGSDDADGSTREKAWKHHPWDAQATGLAKAGGGRHTYIFKRGVDYRGTLRIADQGTEAEPVRLTSDPAWGEGEAAILGSERVSGWKQGTKLKDVPEPTKVWTVDLPFAPRCLWQVAADGSATRIPLARTPNWRESNPDDVLSEWYVWDNPKKHMDNSWKDASGKPFHLGIDTKHVDKDPAYYEGATIWSEWGYVIAGPYPSKVMGVDVAQKGLAFNGKWGGTNGKILRGNRYMLEDKPHYLDDPTGEFYFQKRGEGGGTLLLRLPEGVDPNQLRIEAGKRPNLIIGDRADHVQISGLGFHYTNVGWYLGAMPSDAPDNEPASIRLTGRSQGLRIDHCRFVNVNKALYARSVNSTDVIDDLAFNDNHIERTDQDAVCIFDGTTWGDITAAVGVVHDIELLRNYVTRSGSRPTRYASGHSFHILCTRSAHIAGNVMEHIYGSGIHVFGGKIKTTMQDIPWVRLLIHQNKVVDSMLSTCDWGGIETWQGGPAYVFNNISGNPGGYWNYNFSGTYGKEEHDNARFGHAFYMDGGYKQYYFNNIAWGKSSALRGPLANTAAFQEIWGHETAIFNNTAYRFLTGSRRQSPAAGRNYYLGNVFEDISWMVFYHAEIPRGQSQGNAADAGAQADQFALSTNAYDRNIMYQAVPTLPGKMGAFQPSGFRHTTLADYAKALRESKALADGVGEISPTPLLKDPENGDYSPQAGAPVDGKGVRMFVPWGLTREVGEWHFRRNHADPTQAIDNHWDLPGYKLDRQKYHLYPTWPLTGTGITAASYVDGPLEDWTQGAVRLDGATTYFTLTDAKLDAPMIYEVKNPKEKDQPALKAMVQGAEHLNPEIHAKSMLIEAYVAPDQGAGEGVIIEKRDGQAGWSVSVNSGGRAVFSVRVAGKDLAVTGGLIADGGWHHVVAECDRAAGKLRLYVDGVATEAAGIDAGVSLANSGDLYAGGTPTGRCLKGTLEFLRLAQGSFAEAQTSIGELRAWEFEGPQLRDFTGHQPTGKGRDAGAIEGR